MGEKKSKLSIKKTALQKPVIEQHVVKEPLINIQLFINGIIDHRNATLLGGFLHQEKVAGRVRDTKQNYAVRFETFKSK